MPPPLALTSAAATAHGLAGRGPGVVSSEARSAARTLLDAPVVLRRQLVAGLSDREREHVFRETLRETGSIFALWLDDPAGFTEDVLGETLWDGQRQVMNAMVAAGIRRVAVPAGFGIGKTHLAGRMAAHFAAVHPPGTALVVTTATRFRQVRSQLWPHIRRAVARGGLPGHCDTVQWKMPDAYGNDVQVAYGFSAPDNDEAAMQGIHAAKLLLIVDEAGGIAPLIGKGTNNLLTGDARLLAIGNPAMDDPGSWFEELCAEGEGGEEPSTSTIRIAATDSPAITGAPTPVCRACEPNLDGHTIAGGSPPHLPDWSWLMRTLRDYGATTERDLTLPQVLDLARGDGLHPYVTAKVFARFPQGGSARVIPASWVELARSADEPSGEGYVALRDLAVPGEDRPWQVKRGAWVRLGIDVAAGGGDEFAVYRCVGDLVTEEHVSSGAQNADSMVVADKALACILQAERVARALGTAAPVRVKIDTIGVGWGIVGHLRRMGEAGRHGAQIVAVNVAEGIEPEFVDEASVMVPARKRDQLWLAGRELLQPDPVTGVGRLRLRIPTKTAAQLSQPNLGYTNAGQVRVESKDSMKSRGSASPDRGESVLLSVGELYPIRTMKRRGLL